MSATLHACGLGLGMLLSCAQAFGQVSPVEFKMERAVMTKGYDGKRCWVHARAGIIPADDKDKTPQLVLTTQPLAITGSDVFYALNSATTSDLGKTWSPLVKQEVLARKVIDKRTEMTICDFTPAWHQKSKTLLGTGHTVWYRDNKVMRVRPRSTAYAVYDQKQQSWQGWKELEMPDLPKFKNCGAGSVQRFDLPNGDILLPVYSKVPEKTQYFVTVCLCGFDGKDLTYKKHGTEMTIPVKRGLYEPSITQFAGKFYLTLRNDDHGYVASSSDGLNFEKPIQWKFDDGSDLGNYNTQQHWVTHATGLFLVYTRKGADNDHVFRHRAPLFIGQVDPKTLRVIRKTERILIPERGARLGNFGVVDVSPDETWVISTEWMQTWGPNHIIPVNNKYGADNSIHIAKIQWAKPNAPGR